MDSEHIVAIGTRRIIVLESDEALMVKAISPVDASWTIDDTYSFEVCGDFQELPWELRVKYGKLLARTTKRTGMPTPYRRQAFIAAPCENRPLSFLLGDPRSLLMTFRYGIVKSSVRVA